MAAAAAGAVGAKGALAAEEDPASEINVLRRELREHQRSLREAGLIISSQQDEIIELRSLLAAADVEIEDGQAREHALLLRLVAERERVETTMTAAQSLVDSLREIEVEIQDKPLPELPGEKKRDGLLSDNVGLTIRGKMTRDYGEQEEDEEDEEEEEEEDVDWAEGSALGIRPEPSSPQSLVEAPVRPTVTFKGLGPSHRSVPNIRFQRSSKLMENAFANSTMSGNSNAPAVHKAGTLDGQLPSAVKPLVSGSQPEGPVALPAQVAHFIRDAHAGEIYCMAASTSGNLVATGGDDRSIRVFDRNGDTPPASISECGKAVTALQFLPEDSTAHPARVSICTGGADGALRIFKRNPRRKSRWTLETVMPAHSQIVRKIILPEFANAPVSSLCVLSASTDRTIKLTDIQRGKRPFVATTSSAVMDVTCFKEGYIVSAHKDGSVRLWSAKESTATALEAQKVHSRAVTCAICIEDGFSIVTLSRDNSLKLLDTRMNLGVVREMEEAPQITSDWHRAAACSRYVACGFGAAGDVAIWNIDTGQRVRVLSLQTPSPEADVIGLVAKSFSNPGPTIAPLWTPNTVFATARRTNQVAFWSFSVPSRSLSRP